MRLYTKNNFLAPDSGSSGGGEQGFENYDFLPSNFFSKKETFTTNTCGVKNQQQVSLQTGLLKVTHHLHQGAGSRLPFSLTLSYNQEFHNRDYLWSETSPLTVNSWKFNYQQHVVIKDGFAYYCDGDFNVHKLSPTGDKFYDSENKTGLILTVIRSEDSITGYELTDGSNTKLHFNEHGNLSSITKTISNTTITTTLEYNSNHKLSKVTDGLGKEYTFTYADTSVIVTDQSENIICKLLISNNFLNTIEGANSQNSYDIFATIHRITNIRDNFTKLKTIFYYDKSNRAKSIINYEIDANNNQTEYYSKKITYGSDRVIVTTAKKNQSPELNERKFYYFAKDGTLIYVSDKREDLLESLTVNNELSFEHCNIAFSSIPIAKLPVSASKESEFFYTSEDVLIGASHKIPSQSTHPTLCMLSVVCQRADEEEAVTINLKKGEDVELASLQFDATQEETIKMKNTIFELPAGENEVYLESTGPANSMISEAKIFRFSQNEFEVISIGDAPATHTQIIDGTTHKWRDTKNSLFDISYTLNSEALTLSGVKFTLADYTQTILSKIKNPNSFNLWYNDGANLITGCSNLLIKVTGATEFTALDQIKYATLAITDKSKSFKYISSSANNRIIISDYLHIDGEYKVAKKVYSKAFQLLSETNHQGIETTYTYDTYGDCIKIETNKAGNTDVSTKLISEKTYSNGLASSEIGYYNLLRPTVNYFYDSFGSLSRMVDANSNAYAYGYLSDNQTLASLSSGGITNGIEYEHGRIKKLSTNGTDRFIYDYNENNELRTVTPVTSGESTSVFTLPPNKLSKKKEIAQTVVEEEVGNDTFILKYYDEFSNLRKITSFSKEELTETPLMYYYYWDDGSWNVKNSDGSTTAEETILTKLLESKSPIDPFSGCFITTNSPKLRAILDMTNDKGYNNSKLYYLHGQLLAISYPNQKLHTGVTRDYLYRTTQTHLDFVETDEAITNTITYADSFSEKITNEQVTVNDTELKTNYTYDAIGRTTSVTVLAGGIERNTTYSFTPAQKLNKILPPSSGEVGFGPTTPSNPVQTIGTTNLINKVIETEFDNLGNVATLTTNVEYDNNGNITKYGNNTYVYDSLNRLIRENNSSRNETITYEYDARNNLQKKQTFSLTTDSTPTDPITTEIFNGGAWADQLESVLTENVDTSTTKHYAYDQSGNLIEIYKNPSNPVIEQEFVWNENGQLIAHGNGVTQANAYTYDINGNRIIKTDENGNETRYSYFNGKLVSQSTYNDNNELMYSIKFLYNSTGIIGFKYNGEIYTYRKNLFGDITEIYDGSTCVAKYKYDAFGNCAITHNVGNIANINQFRYRGYYYDTETELYYLNSRYYSPALCRFISADSIKYIDPQNIHGLNLYTYCANNPVMYVDPSGHAWYNKLWDWLNTIAGLLNPISTLTALLALGVAAIRGKWQDVVDDYNNKRLNIFNQDASLAAEAKVLSFYKGSTVVRQNTIGTCSAFGTIWSNESDDATTIMHEYGHSVQERLLGLFYWPRIAIPSMVYSNFGNYNDFSPPNNDIIYYSMPWERTADWLGGVQRDFEYKPHSLTWGIIENLLGFVVVPFYLIFGY
ncbi:MAG: RHS repeat-associated core domain-containing protein [Clostridia bacterium]|nr:RHS repeat-associated core domain-containing protein [Clostridia bacterium]